LLIWTFHDFPSTHPFCPFMLIKKVVTVFLLLAHNLISQGCLYNKSSISFLVGLDDWSAISLHKHILLIPQALLLCLKYTHKPESCISGKVLMPVVKVLLIPWLHHDFTDVYTLDSQACVTWVHQMYISAKSLTTVV